MTKLLAVDYTITGPGVQVSGDGVSQAEQIIGNIIGVLTVFAVIWFVIQIMLAGYAFITTEGDEKKMEVARKRLTEGVIGLALVVVALGFGSLIARVAGLGNVFDLNQMFGLFTF